MFGNNVTQRSALFIVTDLDLCHQCEVPSLCLVIAACPEVLFKRILTLKKREHQTALVAQLLLEGQWQWHSKGSWFFQFYLDLSPPSIHSFFNLGDGNESRKLQISHFSQKQISLCQIERDTMSNNK